ncbi:30S ribosomal protein S1 [Candidatus Fermentibacteria bacterium]|nr:30S ribosomal protein S1 [Candidatus Fermentibacteria bacterium]
MVSKDERMTMTGDDHDEMTPSVSEAVLAEERELELLDAPEYSEDEYQQMMDFYRQGMQPRGEGEVVTGRVVDVTETEVVVDVGFKSEGVILLSEFKEPVTIRVGDEVDVFLEKMENQDGLVVLSKQRADFVKVWGHIKDAFDEQNVVEGRVLRRIKGGLVVDLFAVEAFLPGSQVALRQVPNLDAYLGQTLQFRIIKLNKRRRNIVVSRRVVLEEERERLKTETMKTLGVTDVRSGTVKNITDFGAFIDLGGIDGLLHITDMSWGRVNHPSEVVTIGDELTVKVLSFDKDRERISLGLKQLTPYPWKDIAERYQVGSRVTGRVVSITDYGAFVELEKGVEGLIHISEMSWTRHVRHPSKVLAIGDSVEAVVLKVDEENEKISLGLKQTEPDPWLTLDEKYPVGSQVSGRVRNLTNFGAFVEIEEGIDGLVHISDMSWTKRVRHPGEVLKKGDKVEVMVLKIDTASRRISLGLKQTEPDPWDRLALEFAIGTEAEGAVVRLLDRGVVVDLGRDVEGFVPVSQLAIPELIKPAAAFEVGDVMPLQVIDVDPKNRRIVLSVKAALSSRDEADLDAWKQDHPVRPLTMEDLVENADLEQDDDVYEEIGEEEVDASEIEDTDADGTEVDVSDADATRKGETPVDEGGTEETTVTPPEA